MTTRTIVTSQPDVPCDVCARRLLRGEQPDVFLAAGRRLIVCELCAPRATHEGWLRESETKTLAVPAARPRRARSLIDRWRQVTRAPEGPDGTPESQDVPADELVAPDTSPFDLFGTAPGAQEPPVPVAAPAGSPVLEEALAVFNASEFPRRVAGVARSLGAPVVNVQSAEHLSTVVRIVVAWELCWYRYEVDLSEEEPGAVVLAQGTELSELAREEQDGNAQALDSGVIGLLL